MGELHQKESVQEGERVTVRAVRGAWSRSKETTGIHQSRGDKSVEQKP